MAPQFLQCSLSLKQRITSYYEDVKIFVSSFGIFAFLVLMKMPGRSATKYAAATMLHADEKLLRKRAHTSNLP